MLQEVFPISGLLTHILYVSTLENHLFQAKFIQLLFVFITEIELAQLENPWASYYPMEIELILSLLALYKNMIKLFFS